MSQTTPNYDYTQQFVLASQERQNIATESRDNRNTQFIVDRIDDTSARTLASVERVMDATNNHYSSLGIQAEKLANENAGLFADASAQLSHFGRETAKEHYDIRRDISISQGSIERQAGDYFAKSQQDLVKVENSIGRQADSLHNQSMLKLSQLELQAANNTAYIQLEAAKNKADLSKQLSDCCCEFKDRVAHSEASIKDLVQTVDTSRLRDAVQLAETRNLVLQTRQPPYPFWPPPPPPPFPQGPV